MSAEENKELVRQFWAAIDTGDPAILEKYVVSEYDDHNPLPLPDLPSGMAGSTQAFHYALSAFTDFKHEIHEILAEGDRVASRVTGSGVHTGSFLGVPATGKRVQMSGLTIHRVANGKLVEHWAQIDALSLLAQIGAIPAPA